MAYCYKCGKPLIDGDRFCTHCGTEQTYITNGKSTNCDVKKTKAQMSINFKQQFDNLGIVKFVRSGKLEKMIKKVCVIALIVVVFLLGSYYAYITYRDSQLINKLENTPTSMADGHYYVDMGLSVKWATMNVGASEPYEKGDFFAWGETEPKSIYGEKQYSLQYEVESRDYSMKILSPDGGRDAAYENWGQEWRMPSPDEYEELVKCCHWTWVSYGKYEGLIAVGPNGNCLFFPETGKRVEEEYQCSGLHYWTNEIGSWCSWAIDFWDYYNGPLSNILNNDEPTYNGTEQRRYGLCVRAIHFNQ